MELLNHSLRLLALLYICSLSLRADVLQFFDPSKEHIPSTLTSSFSYFIANDPISLKEFFGDWQQSYHPKSGKNIALQDSRVDIGGNFYGDLYLGVFYKYNVFIKTGRDFTNLYYAIKNKKAFYHDRDYQLDLEIEGIRQSGVMVSQNRVIFKDTESSLTVGGAFSLLFGHDMQEGNIRGIATSPSEKIYQVTAQSSYHYTENYFYDLEVASASGIGYATDIAIAYTNSKYSLGIKFIANDIFSRMHWKDLPYSFVDIQTENKTFNEDGYVKYSPTISGVEKYGDFRQDIATRYKFVLDKKIYEDVILSCGVLRAYDESFPFVRFDDTLSENQDVSLSYESRFKSFGVDYRYKHFMLGLSTDDLSHFSAFGLRSSFQLQF